MNKTLAIEWLNKAYHHIGSAKILFEAKHYTDVIGIDIHYGVEVTLKSILAYENKKIVKTHDLIELKILLQDKIDFDEDELRLLATITTYHIRGSCPPKDRRLPSFEEIESALQFSNNLFDRVCSLLSIQKSEVEY